jgi:tetrahydromethanopterin S-methyltransferase subunit F
LRGRGAPGTMIGMSTRVIGFAIGMALMTAIVFFTGSPARLF